MSADTSNKYFFYSNVIVNPKKDKELTYNFFSVIRIISPFSV